MLVRVAEAADTRIRSIRTRCQQRGVEYFSAFDGIEQAYKAGQPVFFDNDMHFTPEGQRVCRDRGDFRTCRALS